MLTIEVGREDDGRWIAEVLDLPGVLAYGLTRQQAIESVQALSLRVRGEIEELMQGEEYASALQDRFWTMRGDRYVLPLRASAKSLGLGIVHDTSRTGDMA